MILRTLLRSSFAPLAACVLGIALTSSLAVAGPERDERAHFDEIAARFGKSAKADVAALRAELLDVRRMELDDERWIDLHVAMMKVAEKQGAPKPGLPTGVSNPAASSSDPFDQRCHRQGLRPFGEAAYAHKLRTTHGLDMSTMSVLRMGKAARANIGQELLAFAAEHGDGKTWQSLAQQEREARPGSLDDLVTRYDGFTDEAARFVVEKGLVTVPEAALGMRVVVHEGHFAFPFAIYQPGPNFAAGKQGHVVMGRVPPGMDTDEQRDWFGDFNDHFLRIVAVHEGVPGHHLQFTRAAQAYKGLRRRAYNSVYVEGWGLYCEGLLARHGYIRDPLDQLAALRMRAWRAVRCYVDPALHAGLIRPSDAVQLLMVEAGLSRRAAEMEVMRYMRDPTQPIGYWVGREQIERMRGEYLRLNGDDAEREFHDRFLEFGCVPLPLAEAVLLGERAAYDARHPGD